MTPAGEITSDEIVERGVTPIDQDGQQCAVTREGHRPPGIFLHTGWRSGGTWVWSRLRALETVTAFYEPLSTLLGDLSLADIPAVRPTSNSGHPPLDAPYYEEYRSFLQERMHGVVGYQKGFGTDRFGDVPDGEFPAMQAYLQNLCDRSIEQGKVPVLKFCRSQGRLPWLRRAFPKALHVFVLRNPAAQFASGWLLKQEWGNSFFVAAPFRVLGLNQSQPVVKQAIETCGVSLPTVTPTSVDEYAAACERYAHTVEGTHAYRAFMALWILCASRMLSGVDVLIDMDRLGQSSAYAAELRAQIWTQANLAADMGGARDLVEEAKRGIGRVTGIDGRLLRAINFSAQKFLMSQVDSSCDSHTRLADLIRAKLALANEISGQWRY